MESMEQDLADKTRGVNINEIGQQDEDITQSPPSHSHPKGQPPLSIEEGPSTPLEVREYRKTLSPTLPNFFLPNLKSKKHRRDTSLPAGHSASVHPSGQSKSNRRHKSEAVSYKQVPGIKIPLAPQGASLEDLETPKSRRARIKSSSFAIPGLAFGSGVPQHAVLVDSDLSSPAVELQESYQQAPLEQTPGPSTSPNETQDQEIPNLTHSTPEKRTKDDDRNLAQHEDVTEAGFACRIPALEEAITAIVVPESEADENPAEPTAVEESNSDGISDKLQGEQFATPLSPFVGTPAAPTIEHDPFPITEVLSNRAQSPADGDSPLPKIPRPHSTTESSETDDERITFTPRAHFSIVSIPGSASNAGIHSTRMITTMPQAASNNLCLISRLSLGEYIPAMALLERTCGRILAEGNATFLQLSSHLLGNSGRIALLLDQGNLDTFSPQPSDIATRSEDPNQPSAPPAGFADRMNPSHRPKDESDESTDFDLNGGVKLTKLMRYGLQTKSRRKANTRLTGPSGRPLQNISNFPGQLANQPRNLNANGRIHANKPAGGPTWASAGASSMPTQGRETTASSAMESYARATDGQQSNTRPFIDADFPTLANPTGQSQSSQFAAGAWNKPMPSEQSQRQQRQPRASTEQASARTQRSGDGEDFFALSTAGNRQSQNMNPTSSNELPRRSSIFQTEGYQSGGFGSRMIPPGTESQIEGDGRDPSRLTSPSGTSQGMSSSRSPNPQALSGTIGQDRLNGGAPGLPSMAQRTVRQSDYNRPSPQTSQGLAGLSPQDAFSGPADTASPSTGEQQEQALQQILDGMSPQDRWGLAGLNAAFQGPDDFRRSLAVGQDLTDLGLRIDDPEPFLKTWTGPFASPDAAPPRPLNDDFSIPSCYSVQNVVPLRGRITCFSDETLFYIFYTQVKDIMQELVAEELMGRKWRFHIPIGMWMTRDENAQPPVEVEQGISESGTYWWWDFKTWQKVRKPFILKYTDLDDHLQRGAVVGSGVGGGALNSRTGFNAVPDLERMAAGMGRGF